MIEKYVAPFQKELNNNLLLKETTEGKRDLIKHYIFEFRELQGLFRFNEDVLYHKRRSKGGRTLKTTEEVKEPYAKYVIVSRELYDFLFLELQICCIKYNLDFFEICHELEFNMLYFDSGITLGVEERKLKREETETQPKLTCAALAIFQFFLFKYEGGKAVRYKRKLEKADLLWEVYHYYCKEPGRKAWYLTTDRNRTSLR